jgi:ribosomal protein L1
MKTENKIIQPKAVSEKNLSVKDALKQLRSEEKKKFIQSLDLVINLQKIDPRKESINTLVSIPNPPIKRLCAFLTKKSPLVDTITKEEFELYKDNKSMKRLAKKYDSFIASAPLMAAVATKFGRFLGPLGKMPSPQGGLVMQETEDNIKEVILKMSKATKLRVKEKSIKLSVGKEDMTDEQLTENISSVIESISKILPNNKDNMKNVSIKFTMSKPVRIDK